jgi:transcriptional regulator with XRE-family HTH domain
MAGMRTPALKKLGEAVRQHREALKLSQEKLADMCGLHRTYIGGIERGERNVTILKLLQVSEALQIRIADLVRDIEEER